MIRGIHGLLYTSDARATREFIRDKLRLPHTDVGEGWLIFDLPEGDLGCHPIDESAYPSAGRHEISCYCDDIQSTVAMGSLRTSRCLGASRCSCTSPST